MKAITPSRDTARKVSRQPNCWPMKVPSGTPVTSATVSPVNMMAMALAAFSFETRLVAMVEPMEKNTPWARPVTMRASISDSYPGACQASRLPAVNSTISDSSNNLRGTLPVRAVSSGAPTATPRA